MIFVEVECVEKGIKIKFYGKDKREWEIALAKVKAMEGAHWDSAGKVWIVANTIDNNLILKTLGKFVIPKDRVVKSRTPAIFNQCPEQYKEYVMAEEFVPAYDIKERQKKLIDNIELNGPLIPGLRNYQIDFVKFMEARDGRALLGDDMGTGKTLQSLAWLAYKDSFPALIVVTAPTKLQWEYEYRRWLKDFPNSEKMRVLSGQTPEQLDKETTAIINWDILWYWKDILAKCKFKCIIGDEAQAIGNPESKRSKAFMKLAKLIPQCIVMSGTPARSKPSQYWAMSKCVDQNLFPQFRAYTWRYCGPKFDPFTHGPVFDGLSNAKELHYKLSKCMLRRTKDEIMTELPTKQIEVVPLEVNEAMLEQYNRESAELNSVVEKSELRLKVASLVRSAYLLKEKSLIRWAEELIETSGEKVVIFCWHRDVVDLLMEDFAKYNPAKIYGGMSLKEREAEKTKFITDASCKVIIGNIQALGTGVDGLQKVCCKAIFAEFANTITDSRQAEDRLHRGGQTKPVTIYYTCAKGTIDEDLMHALDEKAKVLDSVLDGKDVENIDLLEEIFRKHGFSD